MARVMSRGLSGHSGPGKNAAGTAEAVSPRGTSTRSRALTTGLREPRLTDAVDVMRSLRTPNRQRKRRKTEVRRENGLFSRWQRGPGKKGSYQVIPPHAPQRRGRTG